MWRYGKSLKDFVLPHSAHAHVCALGRGGGGGGGGRRRARAQAQGLRRGGVVKRSGGNHRAELPLSDQRILRVAGVGTPAAPAPATAPIAATAASCSQGKSAADPRKRPLHIMSILITLECY